MIEINNVHERKIHCELTDAGYLIDSLADETSPLWPSHLWPRENFDRALQIGAVGAHGGTRYIVEHYQPGRRILFRFISPKGYCGGNHGFEIYKTPSGLTNLKHVTQLQLKGIDALVWSIAIRWVHDALIEDSLDCAEEYLTKKLNKRNKWLIRVYFLRYIIGCSRLLKAQFKSIL